VTIVEFLDRILAPEDDDISKEMEKIVSKKGITVRKSTKVINVTTSEKENCVIAEIEDIHSGTRTKERFSKVLMSVGRRANTQDLGLENVGVKTEKNGKIVVSKDKKSLLQTNVANI